MVRNLTVEEKYLSRPSTLSLSQLEDDGRGMSEITGINGVKDFGLRRDSKRLGIYKR